MSDDTPREWHFYIDDMNRLIHGYLGIDNDTLWSIVAFDVPALLASLRSFRTGLG